MLAGACHSELEPTSVTFNALAGAGSDVDTNCMFPWLTSLTFLKRCQADVTRPHSTYTEICRTAASGGGGGAD